MKIYLSDCIKSGSKVLSGREEGNEARKKFKLDKKDKIEEKIEVEVPESIYSINISFFLGLFGKSIRDLGEDKFKSKYKFICDEFIQQNIDDGIKKALRVSNVLGGDN